MTIFERVKKLNFSTGEYVVIGAGILEALGIRNTNDVDIIVAPKLFEKLRESKKYKEEIRWGKIFLIGDEIEIGTKLDWENYSTTIEEAIDTATIIDEVPFLNIEETIKFKKAMDREKDFKDVELIEEYLKDSKNHSIQMKLQEKPFNLIKGGHKIIELRLYDEKRRDIKIGDIIEFSKLPDLVEKVKVEITGLLTYKTFSELIEVVPARDLGYTESDKEDVKADMYKIYTKEEEEKYGVLGIKIKLCEKLK